MFIDGNVFKPTHSFQEKLIVNSVHGTAQKRRAKCGRQAH